MSWRRVHTSVTPGRPDDDVHSHHPRRRPSRSRSVRHHRRRDPASTEARRWTTVDTSGEVRYARSGNGRLAFRVFAGGPHTIVWVPSWVSNQDVSDPEFDPQRASLYERMAPFAASVAYDARGTGLSDPLPLPDVPELDGWVRDLHAVVTAAGA